jgi:hypothetical protein
MTLRPMGDRLDRAYLADGAARLVLGNSSMNTPETVTFSDNSRFAYVTLQENNGVAKLDIHSGEITFFGLGQTTHPADLTVDNVYSPVQTLTAFREPDGIALDKTGRFFVTADEGDTRNATGGAGPVAGERSACSTPQLANSSPIRAHSSTMQRTTRGSIWTVAAIAGAASPRSWTSPTFAA